MPTISMDKEYTTRSGFKVVILTTNAPHPRYPVIGYYINTRDVGGKAYDDNDSDADPTTGKTANVTLTSGQAITSIDAGLVAVAPPPPPPPPPLDLVENPKEEVYYRAFYTRIGDPTMYLTIPYKTKEATSEVWRLRSAEVAVCGQYLKTTVVNGRVIKVELEE